MIETLCYGTIYKKLSNSFNIGRLNSTNMSSNGFRFALRPNCHWQKNLVLEYFKPFEATTIV